MAVEFAAVFAQRGRLAVDGAADGAAEVRVRDQVRRARPSGQEAARDLVLALGAGLEALQTMVDRGAETSAAVSGELWCDFPGVLDTLIPRDEQFARASLEGLPVSMLGGPPSPASRRFGVLAAEVEALINARQGGQHAREERRTLL